MATASERERERQLAHDLVMENFPNWPPSALVTLTEMIRTIGPEIITLLRGKSSEDALETVTSFKKLFVDPQVRHALLRYQPATATAAPASSASVEVVKARIPPLLAKGVNLFVGGSQRWRMPSLRKRLWTRVHKLISPPHA